MKKLEDHLALYGICSRRTTDDYQTWAASQLGGDVVSEVDSRREKITGLGSKKRPRDIQSFYDFVAHPPIAPVVHSLKADAIRVSGLAVQEKIKDRTKILDLGCSLGYLTSWYAYLDPARSVLGVDFSRESIREAGQKAKELGIHNLDFRVMDIAGNPPQELSPKENLKAYDAVIDTQTVHMTQDIGRAFRWIRSVIDKDGVFISIPVLETAKHARAFLNAMKKTGFKLLSFDFIYYLDGGISGAYPVIVAGLNGEGLEVEMKSKYEEIWHVLHD